MLEAEMGRMDPHRLLHAYSARLLATSNCSGRTPAMGVSWALGEGFQAPVIRKRPWRSTPSLKGLKPPFVPLPLEPYFTAPDENREHTPYVQYYCTDVTSGGKILPILHTECGPVLVD